MDKQERKGFEEGMEKYTGHKERRASNFDRRISPLVDRRGAIGPPAEEKGYYAGPDRRVNKWKIPDIFGRRSTDKPDKFDKPVEDHPGYVPGAKTVIRNALSDAQEAAGGDLSPKGKGGGTETEKTPQEMLSEVTGQSKTRLRTPLFYTVKDACREAIEEDRKHQNKLWGMSYPAVHVTAEKGVPSEPDSQHYRAYMRGHKTAGAAKVQPESGFINTRKETKPTSSIPIPGQDAPVHVPGPKQLEPDAWAHRSQGMRCATCMFFVPKSDKLIGGDQFTPAAMLGRCRKCAPTLNGWPAVFGSDWCGSHKLDEEKVTERMSGMYIMV